MSIFRYKRVAIDFDGTLVKQVSHQGDGLNTDDYFRENRHIDALQGAAEATAFLRAKGFEILIFTCRPDYQRKYMEGILEGNNITYDYILFYTKPLVDLYIDDKGFRFQNWDNTLEFITEQLGEGCEPNHIGMEPQGDFEQALRGAKIGKLAYQEDKIVVDIGAGSGQVFNIDNKPGPILIGYEPDSTLRGKLWENPAYDVVTHRFPSKIIKGNRVTILGVLEHVDDPRALVEQVMDAGASEIYMTVPNADSFHRYVGQAMGLLEHRTDLHEGDIAVGHKRVWTASDFRAFLYSFCFKRHYYLGNFGTSAFKFTNSSEQEKFLDRFDAINKAAERAGFIGETSSFGAEIYARLWLNE